MRNSLISRADMLRIASSSYITRTSIMGSAEDLLKVKDALIENFCIQEMWEDEYPVLTFIHTGRNIPRVIQNISMKYVEVTSFQVLDFPNFVQILKQEYKLPRNLETLYDRRAPHVIFTHIGGGEVAVQFEHITEFGTVWHVCGPDVESNHPGYLKFYPGPLSSFLKEMLDIQVSLEDELDERSLNVLLSDLEDK